MGVSEQHKIGSGFVVVPARRAEVAKVAVGDMAEVAELDLADPASAGCTWRTATSPNSAPATR